MIFVPKYAFRLVFQGGVFGGMGQSLLKQYDRTVWYQSAGSGRPFFTNLVENQAGQLMADGLPLSYLYKIHTQYI